jgi:sigma-B regulation protein RsbU (phosphoserine phosphatase)
VTRHFFFPADPSRVAEYSHRVAAALGQGYGRPLVRAALSEALLNSILYGAMRIPSSKERNVDALLEHVQQSRDISVPGVAVDVMRTEDGARIRLADSGPGFDWRAELARINQGLDPLASRGRGLAIMRSATASVEWNERGNVVVLHFKPQPGSPALRELESDLAGLEGRRSLLPPPTVSLPRIVVIDDSETTCLLLARMLCEAGYDVETATDSADGLERVIAWGPDLVLLDLVMPGLGGLDLTRCMSQLGLLADTVVVLMSASEADTELRSEAIELGAVDFLQKPIAKRELLARVRRMLSLHGQMKTVATERDRLRGSLDAAALVVQALMPDQYIETPSAFIASMVVPSAAIGGDAVDFVRVSPTTWTVLLMDVAGHGLPAALTVSACRALLRDHLALNTTLVEAVSNVNAHLARDSERTNQHVAITGLRVDEAAHTVEILNAGCPPVAVWKRSGKSEMVYSGAPPAGLLDGIQFISRTFPLDALERVVVVSDGITEAFGSPLDTLGALEQLLSPLDPATLDSLPREAIEARIAELGDDRDDASIVWVRFRP